MIGPKDRNYTTVRRNDRFVYALEPDGWKMIDKYPFDAYVGKLATNNPWRAVKPPGLPPTARYLDVFRSFAGYAECRWKEVGGREILWRGPMIETSRLQQDPTPVESTKTIEDEAVIQALKNLKDQKFNAGVAIAESEGVARMVIDAANLITNTRTALRQKIVKGREKRVREAYRKAYNRFRKQTKYMSYPTWRRKYWDEVKHVQSVRRAQKVPEGWLYYHYGMKPTIDDIDGAVKELLRGGVENPNIYKGTCRGYAKRKHKVRVEHLGALPSINATWEVTRSCRVTLFVAPKDSALRLPTELGVTNPPEAVYNRIPFSFLLDYISNVGDVISVMDAGIGWGLGDTWVVSHRYISNVVAEYDNGYGPNKPSTYGSTPYYQRKRIDRIIRSGLYGPAGTLNFHFKPSTSATRVANVLSLLATGFGRPVRP